jgi:farnesyl-diphosphate farnesyltransferase
MANNRHKALLGEVLKDVSRSFYLTLQVLPSSIRPQIALAYLLARAADTMADTEVLPSKDRLDRLLQFRRMLDDPDPETLRKITSELGEFSVSVDGKKSLQDLNAEKCLIHKLPECLELHRSFSREDQKRVAEVVRELTIGMELDLNRFANPHELAALDKFEELEDYTYQVAGCVGPFWTKICMAHIPAFRSWNAESMCALGIRFGKALQWTNVLRDIPRDLTNGRCYLPLEDLSKVSVIPEDLRKPSTYSRVSELYRRYLDHALDHYDAAWKYTLAIPKSCCRIRLACIWPIWIGLETIALLRRAENPLDPAQRIRINRSLVYAIMVRSVGTIGSTTLLNHHQKRLMAKARGSRV